MVFGRPNPNPIQLPTPPETDTDFLASGSRDFMNAPGVADADMNSHPSTGAPSRRVSTLAYHNSPFRELRERATTRQSRWLIVVIPPAWLVQEHGPFGHTMASGPPQRLSQGVLMPLLPTMYGQLTAIAREFNFPSPAGLCIYLHIIEQGFTMTPRVSDETWLAFWGHLFEAQSPSTQQSPVCGRIEFDIERGKARWLDSWLTSTRRHAVDVPVSVPSSLSHWRGESKNSFDEKADEHSEVPPGAHTRGWSRHIPKKLSLVDKLESLSITSSVANAITGNGVANELSLATISQEDEPKTAKMALEQRVQSWRASSSVAQTPIATTGQIHPDTVHFPNNAQLTDVEVLAEEEDVEPLDLNDFAWSVSSLGPQDHESLASTCPSPQVSSIHLDRRAKGSVLLTPSTATSWGPKSLDYSPMSTLFRLPSPDIGRRLMEDCPPTPSTVTSWGPEELLYSPASPAFRLPSPDLGQRVIEDCPPTASTATSRGRGEPSFSLTSIAFRLPSPDLGLRAPDDSPSPLPSSTTWGPPAEDDSFWGTSCTLVGNYVFPYFTASDQPAWTLIWPFYRTETVASAISSRLPKLYPAIEIYDVVYPHFEIFPGHICAARDGTMPDTVDSLAQLTTSTNLLARNSTEHTGHSSLDIYNGDLRVVQCPVKVSSPYVENGYPTLSIYPPVYPYLCIYPARHAGLVVAQDVEPRPAQKSCSELGAKYPSFNLYPASYPNNLTCIYPPVVPGFASFPSLSHAGRPTCSSAISSPPNTISSCDKVDRNVDKVLETRESDGSRVKSDHPDGIHPAVMGHDLLHASPSDVTEVKGINPRLPEVYPRIPLYSAVYPEFELYPSVAVDETSGSMTATLLSLYPRMRIYPIIYPSFEIYPGHISHGENDGVNLCGVSSPISSPRFDVYCTGPSEEKLVSQPSSQYPTFNLYPPVTELLPSAVLELGVSSTSHGYIYRKARKTHEDLHGEVLGMDALAEELVQLAVAKPQTETHSRGRVRSGTVSSHLGLRQSLWSSPGSLPPVPPLPDSNLTSRRDGSPISLVATRDLADWPVSSHIAPPTQPSPNDDERLVVQSNTLTSANSSQRRDHTRHRQSHRPRDSLVLEKARHLDHFYLSHDEHPSSIPGVSTHLSASSALSS
ncbi:hypothetical protein EI94DRAFT_1718078 [Lactarius quietus]|nr:hypothetical protein EI94DRAFT_1718078 [Lactarius quietus]